MPQVRTRKRSETGKITSTAEGKRTDGNEYRVREESATLPAHTDGTRVCVELGTTEEVAKFNFARVSVRVELPTTIEAVEAAGREAFTIADTLYNELSQKFVGGEH